MPTPSGPTPSDRELLSAYLSDDLEAEAARDLEARLAEEPALAAELDGMAEMLAHLQGLSDVEPPSGYEDRLWARLAGERDPGTPRGGSPGAPGTSRGDSPGAPVTSRGDRPGAPVTDFGTTRRRRWPAVVSAAAAVLLVALVGAGVLGELPFGAQPQSTETFSGEGGGDAGGAEESGDESGEGSRTDAADREQAVDEDTAAAPEPEAAPGRARTPEAHQPGPVVLDDEVALSDEAAVRRRHGELPEARRLLGEALPEARDTATRFRDRIANASPFRSGVRPDACLGEVADAPEGGGPRVPARVETVIYAGRPALAYVLVEPSANSPRLDRVVSRLVRPGSCETRAEVVIED